MSKIFQKNSFIFLWLPVIFYAGLIFYLSSIPQVTFPISFPFMDKLLHTCEYLILGFLLARAIKKTYQPANIKRLYLLVTIIAFVYGISDEFHQAFVPGRIVSFSDVMSDGLGGFLGALLCR